MRENGLTDAALAVRIGVSRPFITRIRTGQRQPSLPVAAKLAAETSLPITAFITASGAEGAV
jgi:transcriptional regulator with XRE-family HTH domain